MYIFSNGPRRRLGSGVQLCTALDELGWRRHSPAGQTTYSTSDPNFVQRYPLWTGCVRDGVIQRRQCTIVGHKKDGIKSSISQNWSSRTLAECMSVKND